MSDLMLIRDLSSALTGARGERLRASGVRGGGCVFWRRLLHTYGSVKIDHTNKGGFLNESTRGLFANYLRNRGAYYGD